jgi:putative flippase GtrA
MLNRLKGNPVTGFITTGVLTVVINLIVFQASLWVGTSIYIATLLGNATSIVVNYFGLSGVFDSEAKFKSFSKYLLVWFAYYFLTIWLVLLFVNQDFAPVESRIGALIILTPLNYLLQKHVIFRKPK